MTIPVLGQSVARVLMMFALFLQFWFLSANCFLCFFFCFLLDLIRQCRVAKSWQHRALRGSGQNTHFCGALPVTAGHDACKISRVRDALHINTEAWGQLPDSLEERWPHDGSGIACLCGSAGENDGHICAVAIGILFVR